MQKSLAIPFVLFAGILLFGCLEGGSAIQSDFEVIDNETGSGGVQQLLTSKGNFSVQGDSMLFLEETTNSSSRGLIRPELGVWQSTHSKLLVRDSRTYRTLEETRYVNDTLQNDLREQILLNLARLQVIIAPLPGEADEIDGKPVTRISVPVHLLPFPVAGIESITMWKRNIDNLPVKIEITTRTERPAQPSNFDCSASREDIAHLEDKLSVDSHQILPGCFDFPAYAATRELTLTLHNAVLNPPIGPDVFSFERQFAGYRLETPQSTSYKGIYCPLRVRDIARIAPSFNVPEELVPYHLVTDLAIPCEEQTPGLTPAVEQRGVSYIFFSLPEGNPFYDDVIHVDPLDPAIDAWGVTLYYRDAINESLKIETALYTPAFYGRVVHADRYRDALNFFEQYVNFRNVPSGVAQSVVWRDELRDYPAIALYNNFTRQVNLGWKTNDGYIYSVKMLAHSGLATEWLEQQVPRR